MGDHDPVAHVDRLRQALEDARRPIALFLGAGCPEAIEDEHGKKPLIPGVLGMTKALIRDLDSSKHAAVFARLRTILDEDGRADADLEYMLSLVRTLRDVAGSNRTRGLTRQDLELLDELISEHVVELSGPALPNDGTPYHEVMRWVGGTPRDAPVEVFTTNYDLLAEQALEEVGVPYFDGFVGAREPFFDVRAIEDDRLPTRWARLWKLHGSINWCRADRAVVRQPSPARSARRLIHPSHLKYEESRRMPYLALHDRLRAALRRPAAVMVTCGYSFRDEHINELLREGLERNASAVVFTLLHNTLDKYGDAIGIAKGAGNLLLLARDEAVVGRARAKWREAEDADAIARTPGVSVSGGRTEFLLGDFAQLAALLGELTGGRP